MQEYPEQIKEKQIVSWKHRLVAFLKTLALPFRKPPFLTANKNNDLRKKTFLILGTYAAFACIAGLICIWIFLRPEMNAERLLMALNALGFNEAELPPSENKGGKITYTNIQLDQDGFSTIENIVLYHTPLGTLKAIEIDGLSITGEIEEDLKISLAGWLPERMEIFNLTDRTLPLIVFRNSRLSLLSDSIGGMTINFDMQMRPQDAAYSLQAKIAGHQASLSYSAKALGTLGLDGSWAIEADIDQAKFSLWPIKVTRISGMLKATGKGFLQSVVSGQLQAGGLNINGLPWHNIALTLDGSLQKTKMIIGARSSGVQGVDLSLTLDEIQNPKIYSGTVYARKSATLLDYLDRLNLLLIPRKKLEPFENIENFQISFRGSPRAILFKGTSNDTILIEHGQIEPQDLQYTLKDLASGLPFDLILKTPQEPFKGTLALSDDRRSLVKLPGRAPIAPSLSKQSSLADIFR
jgi:hypothetical protein